MNVDRMRRYIARTTPDELEREFTREEIMANEHIRWQRTFANRMLIKHPKVLGEIVMRIAEPNFSTNTQGMSVRFKKAEPHGRKEVHLQDL